MFLQDAHVVAVPPRVPAGHIAACAAVCETLAAASKLIASLPDSKFNQET